MKSTEHQSSFQAQQSGELCYLWILTKNCLINFKKETREFSKEANIYSCYNISDNGKLNVLHTFHNIEQ